MSVGYERPAERGSGWGGWGTLVYGTTRIPVRLLVLLGGSLVWVVAMVIVGGGEAITAIWTNALFLVPLVLVGSLVRTVTLRSVALMVFAGGALMGVMYLLAQLLGPLLEDGGTRALLVPFLEELLKVLPVLGFVWVGRRTHTWAIGATDVLILAAASGAGFGVVEDAYIRANSGWPDQIDWLPVTELIGGRLIVGHAIWTALAGATIGLALLLRTRRPLVVPIAVAASGFLVSVVDHAANNSSSLASGSLGDLLNVISQNGWTPLWLFFAAAIGCLAVDAWIVYRRLPNERRYPRPPHAAGARGLGDTWAFVLDRRRLAFARYRWKRAPKPLVDEVGPIAARLDWSLFMRQPEASRAAFGAAVAESAPNSPNQPPAGEQGTVDGPTPEAKAEK